MNTKTYRLARTFSQDHWDRDCGDTDNVLRATDRLVWVEMDVDGYRDMLTDADYYWDLRGEMEMAELARSAKCVLDALVKAGPPEGYAVERYEERVNGRLHRGIRVVEVTA